MIKKPSELNFNDKKLAVIIAGVAGIGKTTLALSAPKPLLIDLDKGVSRVEARYRTDVDVVDSYDELMEDLTTADLSAYESIVIDTGGKLLEMLKPVVIKEDAKNGKRDGNLSLQGYGAVKRKFADFVRFIKSLNKHIIFVFHATEVQLANDVTGLRIRMEGSSKDEVWDDIDIGGFVEMVGKHRTIGFQNCERYYAKRTHNINSVYEIPTLDTNTRNNFLTLLFKQIQQSLNDEVKETALYNETMKLKNVIDTCESLDALNESYELVKNAEHHLTSKDELWFALNERAKELGGKYDKEHNVFNNTITTE